VESLAGVTRLAAGSGFACALLDDGKVTCWGRNERSQLGDGSDGEPRSAPRPVMNLAGVSQLAAARDHACALAGEAVWCWGDNSEGQNGDSTNITSPVPKKVTLGATNVAGVGVAAGAAHACAIDFNHKVWCWGSNFFGQLGNGPEAPSSNVPVQVSGLSDVDQLVARGDFTCARRSTDSSVWCWGDSGLGQLGNEDRPENGGPSQVQRVASAIQITTGFHHACVREPANKLTCWGGNFAGQVGDGSYEDAHLPVDIAGLADVVEIAGGDQHTCAVRTGGTVTCWGDDRRGQLGDGVAARRIPAVAKFVCE
jgi:alpha-tubulin suppressor-like RCC1 family protein